MEIEAFKVWNPGEMNTIILVIYLITHNDRDISESKNRRISCKIGNQVWSKVVAVVVVCAFMHPGEKEAYARSGSLLNEIFLNWKLL